MTDPDSPDVVKRPLPKFRAANERPQLELIVPDINGDRAKLLISWEINKADAGLWRRPIDLRIEPDLLLSPRDYEEGSCYENMVRLSREDARLLRDFLTSILASPDLRDDSEKDIDETC